jgi:hypothetical protein
MLHFRTLRSLLLTHAARPAKFRSQPWQFSLFLALLASVASITYHDGFGPLGRQSAIAAPPETAPAALKTLLTQVDVAANSKNAPAVLKFYGDTFTHSDGLTRQTLEQSLTKLWQQYPQLTYRTELKSWEQDGTGIQAETITYITGTQQVKGRSLKLEAKLQSRQRVEGQKIIRQDILAEQNKVTSGDKPPTLQVLLPEEVRAGQTYNFDAIVQEPLENDLLLGSAIVESVNPEAFLTLPSVELEPLLSGGLFKVGRAPNTPTSQWLSAIVMRHSGMTMVTQRLRVVGRIVKPLKGTPTR